MNQFKLLDKHFPVLPNRHVGEVVSVSCIIMQGEAFIGNISCKRKAWYVNASKNAFHLHRFLCKELAEHRGWFDNRSLCYTSYPSDKVLRQVKKLLAMSVWNSYVLNCMNDDQYTEWMIQLPDPTSTSCLGTTPSLWWNSAYDENGRKADTDWREVCAKWEFPGEDLTLPPVALASPAKDDIVEMLLDWIKKPVAPSA